MFEIPIPCKVCILMASITCTVITDDFFQNAMSGKNCFRFLDDSRTLTVSESFYLNESAVIVNNEKEVASIPFKQISAYCLPWTIRDLVWYHGLSWI